MPDSPPNTAPLEAALPAQVLQALLTETGVRVLTQTAPYDHCVFTTVGKTDTKHFVELLISRANFGWRVFYSSHLN